LETWLKQHPGVLLINRDLAGEFARGAKAGAPEARPPADRFHLLRNLTEVVEKVRGLASPSSENHSSGDNSSNFALLLASASATNKDYRIVPLHANCICIASRSNASARAETFPEQTERPARPCILAPYETYLRARWVEGERNAVGLFREVAARGYTGSRMTIERFLLGFRRMDQQGIEVSQAATSIGLTPRRAVGLISPKKKVWRFDRCARSIPE
jgi:hypothetical protein